MEISSEEENISEKDAVKNNNSDSDQFEKAFFESFSSPNILSNEENEFKSEIIFFNSQETNINAFTELKEGPSFIVSNEKTQKSSSSSSCDTSSEFKLFNKWSNNYNNFDKYSKKCIFDLNSGSRKRVDMPDNMRKKIYTNTFRNIIKDLNQKLSKKKDWPQKLNFCSLSQNIIANVAKSENKKRMKMTLKELILDKSFNDSDSKKDKDIASWNNNRKIIAILQSTKNNEDIQQILEMKIKDIFSEYLKSDEFQKSIEELKQDGRYFEYIHNYIKVAKNFVEYYS